MILIYLSLLVFNAREIWLSGNHGSQKGLIDLPWHSVLLHHGWRSGGGGGGGGVNFF